MSKRISLSIPGKERPNLVSLFKTYVKRRVVEEEEKWRKCYQSRKNRYGQPYVLYDDYGNEYKDEMEQLRRFYGGCFPHSYVLDDDDDDWDDDDYINDDYYVDDDGTIVFPPKPEKEELETTLRPGEYRRSRQDMDDYWNKMSKFNGDGDIKKKHRKHRSRHKAKTVNINEPYNANYIDDNSGDALEDCAIYFYEDYHDKYSRTEFNNLYEFDKYCNEMGFNVPSYVAEQIAYAPVSHCCLNPIAKDNGILEIMREETYGDMFYEACETSELSS